MTGVEVAVADATELLGALRARTISSRELLDTLISRIERDDSVINAVVVRDFERAREAAGRADDAAARRDWTGPLHGLPMTVKEAFDVEGLVTTSGSPDLLRNRAERDATVVARLRRAGAIVFGKTNVPLFTGDLQTYNEVYGTTANPWDPELTPGGSSGGSAAAVAAGFTPLEVGSDIGGSIRHPAHCCGVYGLKPSYGVVSLRGHVPGPPGTRSRADLAVAGPLARSARDLALALGILVGPDEPDDRAWRVELPAPRFATLRGLRVAAVLDHPRCPVGGEVAAVLDATVRRMEEAGARVETEPVGLPDLAASHRLYLPLLYGTMASGFPAEVRRSADAAVETLDPTDDSRAALLVKGVAQRHRHWLALDERRHRLRAQWEGFFDRYDVLVCPVAPLPAFAHDHSELSSRTLVVDGETRDYWDQLFWAGIATVSYLPAAVAPAGLTARGLPVGVQVVGRAYGDREVVAIADTVGAGFVPPRRPA